VALSGPSSPVAQTTDANGATTFTNLDAGTYTIDAQAEAFQDGSASATVPAGNNASATVALQPIPWSARWNRSEVHTGDDVAQLLLVAPQLPPGQTVTFVISQQSSLGSGVIGQLTATSQSDAAQVSWDDWFHPELITSLADLSAGQPFPAVTFSFVASVLGRDIPTTISLSFADALKIQLAANASNPVKLGMGYTIATAWGLRRGATLDDGTLEEIGLPPGGVNLILDANTLQQQWNEPTESES